MADYKQLKPGTKHILTVISAKEQPGEFKIKTGPNSGKIQYSHEYEMEDDDRIVYKIQFCDNSPTNTYNLNLRSLVEVSVKAYHRPTNMHTVELVRRDRDFTDKQAPQKAVAPASVDADFFDNPIIEGTLDAVSLKCAVMYFQYRQEEPENGHTVEKKYQEFRKLLQPKKSA